MYIEVYYAKCCTWLYTCLNGCAHVKERGRGGEGPELYRRGGEGKREGDYSGTLYANKFTFLPPQKALSASGGCAFISHYW